MLTWSICSEKLMLGIKQIKVCRLLMSGRGGLSEMYRI